MSLELVTTEDGSHTLFVPELKEHYHSIHGAIQESKHIFIGNGFLSLSPALSEVTILEVGFGTGLNTLLTCQAAAQRQVKVRYVTAEPEPVDQEMLAQLNYPGLVGSCDERVLFWKIHHTPWDFPYYLNETFILFKNQAKIQDLMLGEEKFDLVYFDAFSPEVQPELWTAEVFDKIFLSMKKQGILLTYSAKGSVKRTLKEAGFEVTGLPGPAGKREITRATRP